MKREKQVVLPPHSLKGCPCKKVINNILKEEPNAEIELRPEVCMKLKCKYLVKSQHGAYRCSRFMQELRGRKRKGMTQVGGTTLRMHKDKSSGWTYRKIP